MKRFWIFFVIALTLGFALGCKKGSVKWVFSSGITVTDIQGNVYKVDPGDWCGSLGLPDTLSVAGLPTTFVFGYAYPNPAKDSTIIAYALPTSSKVHIWIEDRYGQDILDLVNEPQTAGFKYVVWYLQNYDGERVQSGIYRANIRAGEYFHCDEGDILVE